MTGRFICENVFVPLRSGPTHKSEMLSQILFGEKYTVIDTIGSWLKILTDFDDYAGWIDSDHLQFSPDNGIASGKVINRSLPCLKNDNTKLVLEAGSEIYNPDFKERTFTIGNNTYLAGADFNDQFISTTDQPAEIAMKFINSPFIWGGRIPSGIDCSGLTQLVYKIFGRKLPRDAASQAQEGTPVEFLEESSPGDLVFFGEVEDTITHAGMILSSGLVIHASGRVRIDSIDHQGIFRHDLKKYSHTLRLIRRIS